MPRETNLPDTHNIPPVPAGGPSARWQQEVADRLRRIETRLTKFMDANGFDTQTKKPEYHPGNQDRGPYITAPSRACAVSDLLAVVPERPASEPLPTIYPVYVGNEFIGFISR